MLNMVKKPETIDGKYRNIKNHISSVQEENRTALNRISAGDVRPHHRNRALMLKKQSGIEQKKGFDETKDTVVSMFRDVETYIRKEVFNRDKTPENRKFLNFCSPIY